MDETEEILIDELQVLKGIISHLTRRIKNLEKEIFIIEPKNIRENRELFVFQCLKEYINNAPKTDNRREIPIGYIYHWQALQVYVFKLNLFYVSVGYRLRRVNIKYTDVRKVFLSLDIHTKIFHIHKDKKERVWCIPEKLINTSTPV